MPAVLLFHCQACFPSLGAIAAGSPSFTGTFQTEPPGPGSSETDNPCSSARGKAALTGSEGLRVRSCRAPRCSHHLSENAGSTAPAAPRHTSARLLETGDLRATIYFNAHRTRGRPHNIVFDLLCSWTMLRGRCTHSGQCADQGHVRGSKDTSPLENSSVSIPSTAGARAAGLRHEFMRSEFTLLRSGPRPPSQHGVDTLHEPAAYYY